MTRADPQVNIRMPAALKARLEVSSVANGRTLNAEIIQILSTSQIDLRDLFAVEADISGHAEMGYLPKKLAYSVMNGTPPENASEENYRNWWLEAEARFRYQKADAMLKARGL